MVKKLLCVFATSVAIFCAIEAVQSDDISNIPSHLLECYQNPSLYDRQNRLPMTMDMLIELIWTIENYPEFQMDMQSLALSLIHMFRVDGIEEDQEVQATDYTVPFKLTGYQLNKYRLLMRSFIPRSSHQFPNASLTPIQKCSLHFMLSSSIETKQRGDEPTVCSVISGNQRSKRDADDITPEISQSENESSDRGIDTNVTTSDARNVSQEVNASASANTTANTSAPVPPNEGQLQNDDHLGNSDGDIEIVDPRLFNLSKGGEKDKKGDMQMNVDGDRAYVPYQPTKKSSLPESACPVENGVVYTRWGSVSAGTLIAGIATGLAQQEVSIFDIPTKYNGTTDIKVNNQWAATLAGDLAEVAVRQVPKTPSDVEVGVAGGWNSTKIPKWYFIGKASRTEMTDAEIRGGIDGLILSTYIKEWNRKANGYLRLSNVLERYYSTIGVFDPQYQACKRQDLLPKVAPTETMKEQATSFAFMLHGSSPDVVFIKDDGIRQYTESAISKLNSAVPTGISSTCSSTFSAVSTSASLAAASTSASLDKVIPHVDLMVVIDCEWDYNEIHGILLPLREQIRVSTRRSNLTVYSGFEFQNLMNSTNMTMNYTDYTNCKPGMNLKKLLEDDLRIYYNDYWERELKTDLTNTFGTVVLFIPRSFAPTASDLEAARKAVTDYRTKLPDVTFLYLLSGNTDSVQGLVVDRTTDVFTYTDSKNVNVNPVATRLKQVPRRIKNPACGPDSSDAKYNTLQFTEAVNFQGTNYYRVSPRYLFPASNANIKIRGDSKKLKICHSRRSKLPNNSTGSDGTQCSTSESSSEVSINLSGICSGYEYVLQCPPLYISVESIDTQGNYDCSTNSACRDLDDVLYTVTHTGLTCGVGRFLASPFTLTLGVMLMALKSFFGSS
ncbi:uncharacterized protein [Anabrus simplex]|uniref:uncharacterized protein n=1 Tax=Anabrus simplex TaxID=316456 RepID=UPI0035A3CE6E